MRTKWVSKLRKGNLFVIYIVLQTTATTTTTTTKFITLTIPPSILGSLQCRHHFNHHIYYFSSIDTTTFLLSFPSTTTTTFIMLSLRCYYRHYKSINLCKPLRLVSFFMARVLKTQPWFSLILSCFSCSSGPVSLSDTHSTTNPCIKPNPVKVR